MGEAASILLVDDDDLDVKMLRRAWKRVGLDDLIVVARNGQEALDVLRSLDQDQPSLVLVDLDMPVMNGIELIQHMKASPTLSSVPAVVLSTASGSEHVKKAYGVGAAGYFVKPEVFEELVNAVEKIADYWQACAHGLRVGRRKGLPSA